MLLCCDECIYWIYLIADKFGASDIVKNALSSLPASMLQEGLEEVLSDGTMYVAEAAPDSPRKVLVVQSAYIQKNNSESSVPVLNMPQGDPQLTSQTPAGAKSASTSNIIPSSGRIVNDGRAISNVELLSSILAGNGMPQTSGGNAQPGISMTQEATAPGLQPTSNVELLAEILARDTEQPMSDAETQDKSAAEEAAQEETLETSENSDIIDPLESATGVKKSRSINIEGAARGSNPNYEPKTPYGVNCQRCVQAYELRRRGYAVIAKPMPSSGNKINWGNECFGGTVNSPIPTYSTGKTEAFIKKELEAAPDDSRYLIYIQWKGKGSSSHVFIAEKESGTVRYIDPQTGNTDVSHYFAYGQEGQFGYYRLDDKEIITNAGIISETAEKKNAK